MHILMILCLIIAYALVSLGASNVETKTFVAYSMKVAQERVEMAVKSAEDFRKKQPDLFLLGSITKPQMIVIDTNRDDFILVGERDGKSPIITLDDFVVALRARYLHPDVDPGVTIDLRPCDSCAAISNIHLCIHSTIQDVRYFAGVENTRFGHVCYESDWLMKLAGLGFEILLPDLPSRYELRTEEYRNKTVTWSTAFNRFWFYPICNRVNVFPGLVLLEKFQMGVFTELRCAEIEGRPVPNLDSVEDGSAQSFARSFSLHFDRISEAKPVLATLRSMTRLAALTKGLTQADGSCQVDFWLRSYPMQKHATTNAVEVLSVTNEQYEFRMFGGVTLMALALRMKAGDPSSLRQMVFATRGNAGSSLFWEFSIKTEDGRVVGVTLPEALADAKDVAPLFCQAVFLFHQKRYDMAREAYDKVLTLDPGCAEAYSDRGLIRRLQNDVKGAKADYMAAIEANPRYAPPYINLGALFLRERDFLAAADICRKAVAFANNYATAYGNMGIALRHQGNVREAIAAYHKAIELNTSDPVPHYNLGIAFLLDGKVESAVEEFEKAVHLQPVPSPRAWFHLGLALYESGRESDASEAFTKQLKTNADSFQENQPVLSSYDFATVINSAPANDKELRQLATQYLLMIRERQKAK